MMCLLCATVRFNIRRSACQMSLSQTSVLSMDVRQSLGTGKNPKTYLYFFGFFTTLFLPKRGRGLCDDTVMTTCETHFDWSKRSGQLVDVLHHRLHFVVVVVVIIVVVLMAL